MTHRTACRWPQRRWWDVTATWNTCPACKRRDHVRKGAAGNPPSTFGNRRPVRDSMSRNKWARRPWRIKRTPSNPKTHPAWLESFVRHHPDLRERPSGMSATCKFQRRALRSHASALAGRWQKHRCVDEHVGRQGALFGQHSRTKGLVMAEVMIELVDHGVPRTKPTKFFERRRSCPGQQEELIDVCSRTPAISAAFSAEELESCSTR